MSVSKSLNMVKHLSFEFSMLLQYNFDLLNHEWFKKFSRGDIFFVSVIPVRVGIFFLFGALLGPSPSYEVFDGSFD